MADEYLACWEEMTFDEVVDCYLQANKESFFESIRYQVRQILRSLLTSEEKERVMDLNFDEIRGFVVFIVDLVQQALHKTVAGDIGPNLRSVTSGQAVDELLVHYGISLDELSSEEEGGENEGGPLFVDFFTLMKGRLLDLTRDEKFTKMCENTIANFVYELFKLFEKGVDPQVQLLISHLEEPERILIWEDMSVFLVNRIEACVLKRDEDEGAKGDHSIEVTLMACKAGNTQFRQLCDEVMREFAEKGQETFNEYLDEVLQNNELRKRNS